MRDQTILITNITSIDQSSCVKWNSDWFSADPKNRFFSQNAETCYLETFCIANCAGQEYVIQRALSESIISFNNFILVPEIIAGHRLNRLECGKVGPHQLFTSDALHLRSNNRNSDSFFPFKAWHFHLQIQWLRVVSRPKTSFLKYSENRFYTKNPAWNPLHTELLNMNM